MIPVSNPTTREEMVRERAREALRRPLVIEPVIVFVGNRVCDPYKLGSPVAISVARVRAMGG